MALETHGWLEPLACFMKYLNSCSTLTKLLFSKRNPSLEKQLLLLINIINTMYKPTFLSFSVANTRLY